MADHQAGPWIEHGQERRYAGLHRAETDREQLRVLRQVVW